MKINNRLNNQINSPIPCKNVYFTSTTPYKIIRETLTDRGIEKEIINDANIEKNILCELIRNLEKRAKDRFKGKAGCIMSDVDVRAKFHEGDPDYIPPRYRVDYGKLVRHMDGFIFTKNEVVTINDIAKQIGKAKSEKSSIQNAIGKTQKEIERLEARIKQVKKEIEEAKTTGISIDDEQNQTLEVLEAVAIGKKQSLITLEAKLNKASKEVQKVAIEYKKTIQDLISDPSIRLKKSFDCNEGKQPAELCIYVNPAANTIQHFEFEEYLPYAQSSPNASLTVKSPQEGKTIFDITYKSREPGDRAPIAKSIKKAKQRGDHPEEQLVFSEFAPEFNKVC